MKTPKKNIRKTTVSKGVPSGEPKKTRLKPVSRKSKKNWKNRILEEEEDLDITFDDDLEDFDDLENFDDGEDFDRY